MNLKSSTQLVMSSREIAEYTGKQHSHVFRDIKKMLADLDEEYQEYIHIWTHPQNKQSYEEFTLNRDLTDCLLTGYSAKARLKVIKRWKELEHNSQHKVPVNFSEALQLAADQAKQLELAAPKVAFVDKFVDVGTTKTLRETAKILSYPERKMIALMIDHDILYRMSGNLLPYQKYHEQKLFEVKTGERNGHAYTQTRVTTKGVAWLGQRYASDLMEDAK